MSNDNEGPNVIPLLFTDTEGMTPAMLYQDLGQKLEGSKALLVVLITEDEGEDVVSMGHSSFPKLKLLGSLDLAKNMLISSFEDM
jgi:hypothetical protein